jgi:hypothetical protein
MCSYLFSRAGRMRDNWSAAGGAGTEGAAIKLGLGAAGTSSAGALHRQADFPLTPVLVDDIDDRGIG